MIRFLKIVCVCDLLLFFSYVYCVGTCLPEAVSPPAAAVPGSCELLVVRSENSAKVVGYINH